jgi:hypothetical protein
MTIQCIALVTDHNRDDYKEIESTALKLFQCLLGTCKVALYVRSKVNYIRRTRKGYIQLVQIPEYASRQDFGAEEPVGRCVTINLGGQTTIRLAELIATTLDPGSCAVHLLCNFEQTTENLRALIEKHGSKLFVPASDDQMELVNIRAHPKDAPVPIIARLCCNTVYDLLPPE